MKEKTYWRSIERLIDSPAMREQLAREFPDGADVAPDAMTRRTLFRLFGASAALAGLTACRRPVEQIFAYDSAPEEAVLGVPRFYATTMPFGTSAYGVLVETHEGRPTKIEGNELHPASRGAASAWMQGAILDLYDPDRTQWVSHVGQPASWKEFLDFWRGMSGDAESAAGEGLAVITEAYSSPTMARLADAFRQRFPKARWAVHEPLGDENIFEGLRLATGTSYRPVYALENARTIVALDADFLLTESESVAQAKGFAAGRSPEKMNRLYVVESTLSLTGANADHRVRIRGSEIAGFAAALGRELGAIDAAPPPPAMLGAKVKIIARDLASTGSRSVVLAGRRQPPEVHALAFAMNRTLGALGTTVTLREPKDAAWSDISDLRALVAEMRRGAIRTLVIVGGNPAYTAFADLDFVEALRGVRNSIHLASHPNETARVATWLLPQTHFLEAWGDARAADGTLSVVQPLIAPLFDARSAIELLAMLAFDDASPAYGLVRQTWLETILGTENAEGRWNRVLHDGLLQDSALPPVIAPIAALPQSPVPSAPAGIEVVFTASTAAYDGRYANNGWLQETPDPISRICWDNAALISPATAREHALRSGDVVRLRLRGRDIEVPVSILPGQADGVVALALGHGRSAAGRVGDGVGANAYLLRDSDAPGFDLGVQIEKSGRTYSFAQTQEQWEISGGPIAREPSETPALWTSPPLTGEYQWGMAIDLSSCIGCNACVVACQSENNIPVVGREQVARGRTMQWLRVDRYFAGVADEPEVLFQPVPCMQCENAPCEQVCPVGATLHDREGMNVMVYNRCVGTRYCSNNCPYKVRRFNFFNYTKDLPELVQMAMNPDVTVRSRGVMEKCTYCIQRTTEAKLRAKREERTVHDGEVKTACQQTCPVDAIVFGNIADPQSRVSRLKKQNRNYTLLDELKTKPRTSYLAKLRNPNPEWESV